MTRIDRRALFTSGAAAALLAATGLSARAQPQRGGRLRLALPRNGTSLAAIRQGVVFETLTEVAPDGMLRGELATGWTTSGDARRWEITLREGVRFHDGRAFAAADALVSLVAHPAFWQAHVAAAEAVGPHRLQIELRRGNPDLPLLLADSALVMAPAQGVAGGAIGTGAYRVVDFAPERRLLAQRVNPHHQDGNAAWFDSIEALVIPDAAVRAEALRDGFVDVAELPMTRDLLERGDLLLHPSPDNVALAARRDFGIPSVIGAGAPLDDGRIGRRWWRT